MTESIHSIISKARELAGSIRAHEITSRYNECRGRMNNDRTAQMLYSKLVAMGKELNEQMASGGPAAPQRSSEYELLQRELEENTLVKEYIQSQKAYLDLLNRVIEKIKNPLDD